MEKRTNTFLNNLGLLFKARKKILRSFKSRLFPIKSLDNILTRKPAPRPTPEVATEPTPTKHNKSKLKSNKNL